MTARPVSFASLILLIIVVMAVVMIVKMIVSRRGGLSQRICSACNAGHPRFAKFCRECGKRLG